MQSPLISVLDGFYDTLKSGVCQTFFRPFSFIFQGNSVYFLSFLHLRNLHCAKSLSKSLRGARFSSFSLAASMV